MVNPILNPSTTLLGGLPVRTLQRLDDLELMVNTPTGDWVEPSEGHARAGHVAAAIQRSYFRWLVSIRVARLAALRARYSPNRRRR